MGLSLCWENPHPKRNGQTSRKILGVSIFLWGPPQKTWPGSTTFWGCRFLGVRPKRNGQAAGLFSFSGKQPEGFQNGVPIRPCGGCLFVGGGILFWLVLRKPQGCPSSRDIQVLQVANKGNSVNLKSFCWIYLQYWGIHPFRGFFGRDLQVSVGCALFYRALLLLTDLSLPFA